jgi:hypothetical protein
LYSIDQVAEVPGNLRFERESFAFLLGFTWRRLQSPFDA